MALKQISLTIPENLLNETKEYSKEFGYRNVQEFILELVRNRVLFEKIERYQRIERDMKKGKNVKKFSQKDAVKYLKSL
jgi:metal-responsive CopG/Arc/MetJ family transcriptional regulator